MRVRAPRPVVVDLLIAVAMLWLAARWGAKSAAYGWPEFDLRAYLLIALVYLPVALRRRAPLVVFALVQCACLVYIGLGYWPAVGAIAPMLILYTVTAARPAWMAVGCAAVMAAGWIYGSAILHDVRDLRLAVTQALAYCLGLLWLGTLSRRAGEQARRARAAQAQHQVAQERGRIARELHDVVAHHMAVVSVQAGLARFVLDSDAGTARSALGTIEEASSEALEELRRMLQVLRQSDPGGSGTAAPIPTLARLDDLIDRVRAAGLPVELSVSGTARPLAPGIELCAYRVVQEALTNALKHAQQAPARVRLQYRPRELMVSIQNDRPATTPIRVAPGTGHGLLGMRERARIYGGTISIGTGPDGGFEVCLTLPTTPAGADRDHEHEDERSA